MGSKNLILFNTMFKLSKINNITPSELMTKPCSRTLSTVLVLTLSLCASVAMARSVWDKTISHPLPNGRLLAGDRCHFGTTNCAGTGTHLGVDLMAPGGTAVVAMCDGTVKHNNTAMASIWNSKVIVEHNCGGQFQKIYGYYGHVASSLAVDSVISSGDPIGTLKDDGGNSHLHMGIGYFYGESNWGYGTSSANWLDFQNIVNRSSLKPVLRNPADNSNPGTDVSFTWDSTENSTSYRIVISQDPNPLRNFDNLTRTCNGTPNGGSACWTNSDAINNTSFTRTMTADKTYYWVIRGNTSDWSDIGSFSSSNSSNTSTAASWSSGAYRNNEILSKNLSIAGASNLTVTVTGETESGYDYLYVYDANNVEIRKLSGVINQTFTVRGSSILAKLITDPSITKSGVTVSISSSGAGSTTASPDVAAIDRCYTTFSSYFGQKIGSAYSCFSQFTCQDTSGPITKIAVEKNLAYNVFFYLWGDGWNNLDMQYCK